MTQHITEAAKEAGWPMITAAMDDDEEDNISIMVMYFKNQFFFST